ncbi:MAG: type II toxin-antitoxin system HicB family antitoxin [Myxococcales bacterium]|nr:type II toxin-antitoxin system HicB family antitoxin [Myxococcales bacterium]MCB9581671.1 type II toxin-antitoxin system HicB family antitoxin [Polyangiaceae bacterium]
MEFPVLIQPSPAGDSVQAFCPDLPGCSATATSVDEALEVLGRRINDYFARDAEEALPPGMRRTVIVL